jgi:fumarate reductase flavoprotein subunit
VVKIAIRAADSFSFSVPLAIVGAGACGLTAALAAETCGLLGESIWVFERDSSPSGSTAMSYGGICAAGSAEQNRMGVADSPAALYADIMAATRGETDPDLAQLIAREAGPAMDWLMGDIGLPLTLMTDWTGLGHSLPRLHAPESRSGRDLMGMLLTAVEARGIELVTEARVDTLYVDAAHERITGVGIDRRGDREDLGCDALVLASCGYGGNPELVRRYIPEMAGGSYYGHEGNTGDALQWGHALGAATADLGAYQALGSLATPHNVVIPHTLLIGGGVQVNAQGQRFEDELDNISGQALNILAQPGGYCWLIYDERLHQQALEGFQEYRDGSAYGVFRRADTIEELATGIQLPEQALVATLAELAASSAADGRDKFGRDFSNVAPLQAPFYAIKVTGALFHTQGGLCIDSDARVRRQAGGIIHNLYAGGGAARSVSGPGIWGYLPGMGLCTAVTLGRVAGRSAALLLRGC